MTTITLQALYRYPVKSLRGEELNSHAVDARGLAGDRRWMVVDDSGRFLTQRQHARMALVDARLDAEDALRLAAPEMPPLTVTRGPPERLEVRIWGDRVRAESVDPAADAWLSEFIGRTCRLVHLTDASRRAVDPDYATADDQVGFADGFPFLLISQGSLDDLNSRLERPLPMLRFRPNLVVDGCAPYAEDGWRRIRIGELEFRVAKPCSRCVVPTIDFATGERGREPLQTLMTYRRRDSKIYFGQNLIHDRQGRLERGMPVEVLA